MSDNRIKITRVFIQHLDDLHADLSYLTDPHRYDGCPDDEVEKYRRQDADRLASYGVDWTSIGVRAVAEIAVPIGETACVLQTVVSPGCWGIDSDASRCELDAIAGEELHSLRSILRSIFWPGAQSVSPDDVRIAFEAANLDPFAVHDVKLADQFRCFDCQTS